ncbi:hypothetical protein BGZ73_003050 [Actinomortierella ambigua]|nr:hypothetical protein BGZ73_003050 [Actinomortierella ambigua]
MYVLAALMKLTSRFQLLASTERVEALIEPYLAPIVQRSIEYRNLFQYFSISLAVLERMPVIQIKETVIPGERLGSPFALGSHRYWHKWRLHQCADFKKRTYFSGQGASRLDLLVDLFSGPSGGAPTATTNTTLAAAVTDLTAGLGVSYRVVEYLIAFIGFGR